MSEVIEKSQSGLDHKGLSWLLMIGHLSTDLNQGALAAVIPFLVIYNGFSYTDIAFILLAANSVSAIIQPLFGWLGDKTARPWLMALGTLLAGLGLTGVGAFESYPLVLVSAAVCGVGIAMFHPEGGRLANLVAGKNKGTGMSVFAVGGNLGFALGPIIAVASIGLFGLSGTAIFLIISIICACVLLYMNNTFKSFGLVDSSVALDPSVKDRWGVFGLTMGVLSARSIIYYAITAYAALFIVAELGQNEVVGSSMISVFAAFSVLGTFASGKLAGKFGVHNLTRISYLALAVLLVIFAFTRVLPVSVVLLAGMGFFLSAFQPAALALAQGFIPHHLGMASGLSFGVIVCIGGVCSPLFGSLGDAVGLTPVMAILALVALAGVAFSVIVQRVAPDSQVS